LGGPRRSGTRRRILDRLGLALIVALAILAVAPLFHILYVITLRGAEAIAHIGLKRFIVDRPHPFNAENPGGIGPALLGTLELSAATSATATLIALPAAILVAELRGSRISRLTLLLALTLVELPTILVGLTAYAILVDHIVGHYNMLAGILALTLVILPYIVVEASESLRQIPAGLREAAYSLGAPRTRTIYEVIAPAARRGILVGILIGLARAAGETAPLLFTIGGAYEAYHTCLTSEGGAVPLMIYQFIQMPFKPARELAWGASLVLLLIVVSIMVVARLLVREVRL